MIKNRITLIAAALFLCNIFLGNMNIASAANQEPIGYLDAVVNNTAHGWAYDADSGAGPVAIHFYADNATFVGAVLANLPRPDVNQVHRIYGDHGYKFTIPMTGLAPGQHQLYAYAINYPAGNNPLLLGSPKSFTVSAPVPAPTISSFTAAPANITSGQSTTLSWSAVGATSLSINQGIGAVSGSNSSMVVAPSSTTTYVITAGNSTGTVTASVPVTVAPPVLPALTIQVSSPNNTQPGITTTTQAGSSYTLYAQQNNVNFSGQLDYLIRICQPQCGAETSGSWQTITQGQITVNLPANFAAGIYKAKFRPHDQPNTPWSNEISVTVTPGTAPLLQGVWVPPAGLAPVEVLRDTDFTKGLRAWWSCTRFEGDNGTENLPTGLTLGNCLEYDQPMSGYTIKTLPDTGVPVDNEKFWNLNEGYHKGPMDLPGGLHIAPGQDLQIHRMEVNSRTVEVGPNTISIQGMNNLGLSPSDPLYNTRLAHSFKTNRHGSVTIYANTKNLIRNVATDHGPNFQNDTWPTFYLDQNFKQLVDLSNFSTLDFSANLDIPLVTELSGWTGPYKDATVSMVVLLRKKANPFIALWLVNSLYSESPVNYQQSLGVDQWGIGMYRASIQDHGGPLVPGAAPRTIHVDVLENLRKAIALNPVIGNIEDYYLAGIEIGWESLGYHEYKLNVSNVSMKGTLNPIFYPKVFNVSKYLQLNPDLQNYFGSNLAAVTQHWKNYGVSEGRQGSAEFSAVRYLQRYPDVAAAFGATNYLGAIHHYVNYGINEGRDGS